MQVILNVQASRPVLTRDEILELIGEERIEQIKLSDAHPMFKAFVIAHEGISSPVLLSTQKQTPIEWNRVTVQNTYEALQAGTKFFYRHNSDNSQEGREQYGEVVAKTIRDIDGKLSAIAIGYFKPDKKDIVDKVKSVSMEFMLDMVKRGKRLAVKTVEAISAIALGAPGDVPAFDGAVEVVTVQAFKDQEVQMDDQTQTRDNDRPLDYRELKRAVRYNRVKWHQLYNVDDLIGDIKLRDGKLVFTDTEPEIQQMVTRALSPVLEENQQLSKKLEDNEKQLHTYRSQVINSQSQPVFEQIVKDMDIPAPVANYAREYLKDIKVDINGAVSDQEVNLILTRAVKDHIDKSRNEVERLERLGFVPKSSNEKETRRAPALGDTEKEEENPLL